MKPHDTFLELAATAIDFRLTPAQHGRLVEHLAGCPACRHTVDGLHADTLHLAELPAVQLPERRADEIIASVLHPGVVRQPVRLLAVVALLGLLLIGSLVVGAEIVRRLDDNGLVVVPPVPTQTQTPDASPGPSSNPGETSPFGRLVVVHDPGSADWIEVVSFDGTAPVRVVEGRNPAWVASDRIVYTCDIAGQWATGVCAVNAADPASTSMLLADADRPAPAPDGSTIAVHRGTTDVGETWLMASDGSGPRLLHSGTFLEWSPDGQWLVGQPESATFQIAIVRADGAGFRVLAPGYDPAWSSSGARIAFALVDGEVASMRIVDVADGGVDVRYTAPAGAELSGPVWLPDGGLVFVQAGDLWRLDVGTDVPVRLTTGLAIQAFTSGDPLAISADGRWIAFETGSGPDARVGIVSVDGKVESLDLGDGTVSQPQWGPVPAGQGSALLGRSWGNAVVPVAPDRPLGRIEAVTAGGPGFVAVGRGCLMAGETGTCEAIVWTSTDGRVWQRPPASDALDTGFSIPMSGPEMGMFDVAAGTPGIVAVGYAAKPRMQATAWFSTDGATWQRIALGAADTFRVHAVAWSGRAFVIVGEDRTNGPTNAAGFATAKARAGVWVSSDGRSWAQVPYGEALDVGGYIDTLEDPAGGGMTDVVASPGGLVAVGSICQTGTKTCGPAAWTSVDGMSWERATGVPQVSGFLKGVAASGTGYVAVGAEACGSSPVAIPGDCPPLALTSTDGRTWTQARWPFTQSGHLRTVTRIGDAFFATAPDGPATLWTSADGATWAPGEVSGGPATSGEGVAAEWHFAAGGNVAVWLGTATTESDPAAWVSTGTTP